MFDVSFERIRTPITTVRYSTTASTDFPRSKLKKVVLRKEQRSMKQWMFRVLPQSIEKSVVVEKSFRLILVSCVIRYIKA